MKEKPSYTVECYFDHFWGKSVNCRGPHSTLKSARLAVKRRGSVSRRYRIVKHAVTAIIIKP